MSPQVGSGTGVVVVEVVSAKVVVIGASVVELNGIGLSVVGEAVLGYGFKRFTL